MTAASLLDQCRRGPIIGVSRVGAPAVGDEQDEQRQEDACGREPGPPLLLVLVLCPPGLEVVVFVRPEDPGDAFREIAAHGRFQSNVKPSPYSTP